MIYCILDHPNAHPNSSGSCRIPLNICTLTPSKNGRRRRTHGQTKWRTGLTSGANNIRSLGEVSLQHGPLPACIEPGRPGGRCHYIWQSSLVSSLPAQTQTSGPWWKLLKISDSPPPCLAWLPVVTSFWQNITVLTTRDRSIRAFDQWMVRKI